MTEVEQWKRRFEIARRAADRYCPCPDCRDKVTTGQCQRCARQRAEAALLALYEAVTKQIFEPGRRQVITGQHGALMTAALQKARAALCSSIGYEQMTERQEPGA